MNGEVIDTADVKKYFNMIRYRTGLPGVTDSDVANKERMRELGKRHHEKNVAGSGEITR